MDVLHACCAELDAHKDIVVASVQRVDPGGKVTKAIETVATITADLLDLSDWPAGQGVKVVAMKSTGSYWRAGDSLRETQSPFILPTTRKRRFTSRAVVLRESSRCSDSA